MKLAYPLWCHIPTFVAAGIIVSAPFVHGPLPTTIPLHFDFTGRANRWGSSTEGIGMAVLVAILPVAMQVTFGELLARSERKVKRFAWFVPLLSAHAGFLAAIMWHLFTMIDSLSGTTHPTFNMPWIAAFGGAGVCGALTTFLEILRPASAAKEDSLPVDPAASKLAAEVTVSIHRGDRWAYFERQRVLWIPVLAGIAAFVEFLIAFFISDRLPSTAIFLCLLGVLGLFFVLATSSLRVAVDGKQLRVSAGVIRVPLLRLRLADLTSAAPEPLQMLADYGGWGIRYRRKTWVYVFRGNQGVRIRTCRGKQYIIGTDAPDRLAAVLQATVSPPVAG